MNYGYPSNEFCNFYDKDHYADAEPTEEEIYEFQQEKMNMPMTINKPNKKELKDFVRDMLDLANITYTVSNGGKEILFKSQTDFGGDVRLYPTTGTFMNNGNTFKCRDKNNHDEVMNQVKFCLESHIAMNMFGGKSDKPKKVNNRLEDLQNQFNDDELPF